MKEDLLKEMVHYMKYGGAKDESDPNYDSDFDAGYTQEDVDCCGELLDAYLESLRGLPKAGRNERILANVKATILALNKLNAICDGVLIETDQREAICELVIAAATKAGLRSDVYDITEQWRQW